MAEVTGRTARQWRTVSPLPTHPVRNSAVRDSHGIRKQRFPPDREGCLGEEEKKRHLKCASLSLVFLLINFGEEEENKPWVDAII